MIDGYFTLHNIRYGFEEANPFLKNFINHNLYFLGIKYIITVVGILSIALHRHFRYVKVIMGLIIVGYLVLDIYQVIILLTHG